MTYSALSLESFHQLNCSVHVSTVRAEAVLNGALLFEDTLHGTTTFFFENVSDSRYIGT